MSGITGYTLGEVGDSSLFGHIDRYGRENFGNLLCGGLRAVDAVKTLIPELGDDKRFNEGRDWLKEGRDLTMMAGVYSNTCKVFRGLYDICVNLEVVKGAKEVAYGALEGLYTASESAKALVRHDLVQIDSKDLKKVGKWANLSLLAAMALHVFDDIAALVRGTNYTAAAANTKESESRLFALTRDVADFGLVFFDAFGKDVGYVLTPTIGAVVNLVRFAADLFSGITQQEGRRIVHNHAYNNHAFN